MANSNVVYAIIGTILKEQAEKILKWLEISPSSTIKMLYSSIVESKLL